jgi:DNA-binding XRE family transcriptional regulator
MTYYHILSINRMTLEYEVAQALISARIEAKMTQDQVAQNRLLAGEAMVWILLC